MYGGNTALKLRFAYLSAGRPRKVAARQQMKMDMVNGLPPVLPAVVYNAVAIFEVFLLCNFCDCFKNAGNLNAVGGIYFISRADMLFRDYYRVKRRFRVNIAKGVNILVLIDLCARNLSCNYFTKKTV